MTFPIIVTFVVLASFQTLFCTLYSSSFVKRRDLATPVFCILQSIIIALMSLAFNAFRFNLSLPTLIIGVLNAAVLFGYNVSIIAAGSRGSYAFMNVSMLFGGILIPLVYNMLFVGGTELPVIKYVAIGTMLVSCVLMNLDSLKPGKVHISYYIFCLLLFIFNGMYGTFLKMQEQTDNTQSKEMVIITYLIMGVIAFAQLAIKEKKDTFKAFRLGKKSILMLALSVISAGIAINLLVIVIPFINTAILFTVDNGGALLLATIYAIVLFKEKPTIAKISGILLAIASITVLSI